MPADFGRVKEVFLAAAEMAYAPAREAYLREACGGDDELRRQVEALLRHHEMSGSILESPFVHSSAITEDGPAVQPLADDADAPPEAEGGRVGPYRLVQKLGEGGMGVVWQAEQTEPLKRRVALKLIKPGMDSAHVVRRFEAERQALALMDHPNIARVFDAATTAEGRPYFVMELVRGVPITKYCDELHLTVRERLELFVPVCRAIQHAHTKGIIHRDIKPSNVLVSMQDGEPVPKVIDFGVAKALHQPLTDASLHTAIGQLVGTLEYASPEQAELSALDVDTRSDTYSLGVLLYELLTGTTPIDRKRMRQAYVEVVRLIRDEEPPPPSSRLTESAETLAAAAELRRTEPRRLQKAVRGELDWIVLRCLEKDRTRRYETADGLARDIERHLADEPVEACRPGVGYRLGKFLRRHRAGVLTAAAFVLLLVAATAISTWQAMRATAERDEKEEARKEAVESEERAVEAAEAERKAKELAGRRLGQIEKANEVLAALFDDLDPATAKPRGQPLFQFLGERVQQAASHLDGFLIDDPLTLARLQKILGKRLNVLGHSRQAIILLSKARDTLQARRGANELDTVDTVSELAKAYGSARQYDMAVPLFEDTVKRRKAKLGPDHDTTLRSMDDLAAAYRSAWQHDKAVPLLEELLKQRQTTFGPDHTSTFISMSLLATTCEEAGQPGKALPLYEELWNQRIVTFGPDHPQTLFYMFRVFESYKALGQLAKALPIFEETLKRVNASPKHPMRLSSLYGLAELYLAAGQSDKAPPLLTESLAIQKARLAESRAKHGRTSPQTFGFLDPIATNLLLQQKYAEAEPVLRELLTLREKGEPDSWPIFYYRSQLGGALLGQKKYAEAETLLVAGYEGMKRHEAKIPPARRYRLTQALERLAELYDKTGAKDKAAARRKELEAARAAAKKKPAP